MKTVRLLLFFFLMLFMAACTVKLSSKSPKSLPPGQAKKIAGSQSARPYAPGQQKH